MKRVLKKYFFRTRVQKIVDLEQIEITRGINLTDLDAFFFRGGVFLP